MVDRDGLPGGGPAHGAGDDGRPASELPRSTAGPSSIEHELRRRLVNEDRLTKLARTFMADDSDFDSCVQRALELMGSLEGVDSIGIWCLEDGLLHHRYQWTAPGIEPTIGTWPPFAPDAVTFTRRLQRFEEITLRVPDDDSEESAHMARMGARCFVAVPMASGARFMGFVSFASYGEEDIFAPTHRSALRTAAGIFAEAFARHAAQQRLAYQARHDSLTGLANRWAFTEAVDDALESLERGRSAGVAVVLFDLDRFHVINDSLGHAAGDQLLVSVAERLAGAVRDGELLCRLGGDELVVLLGDVADGPAATRRAEDLLGAIDEPFSIGASRLRVTSSVGVAVTTTGGTRTRLLREADAAMYAAKRGGGARVQRFDGELHRWTTARHQREHDLHGVVERGELCLHYQPEFDLRTGAVVAVEALLRWNHPRHGLLVAGDFVGVAEDAGLIVEIGQWVLDEAFRQLRTWADASVAPVTLRVNLSARQIAEEGVVDSVRDHAARHGVDPSSVCFELTETAMVLDPNGAAEVLGALHDEGFAIAVDDFGTGYSSLAYLRDFPVDVVKVDRSFIHRLGTTPADVALVRAIIRMADALGLSVTAEGIETFDQLGQLVDLGCPNGQGFLLARPAPPDEVAATLTVTPAP